MGLSLAIGDVDGDGYMRDRGDHGRGLHRPHRPQRQRAAQEQHAHTRTTARASFGWGGGLAIADMDGDGFPEIAFGATVFTTKTGGPSRWRGRARRRRAAAACGGALHLRRPRPDGHGTSTCSRATPCTSTTAPSSGRTPALPDGFPGVADFNGDGKPDVVLVGRRQRSGSSTARPATVELTVRPRCPAPAAAGPRRSPTSTATGTPEIGVAHGDLLLGAEAQLHDQQDRRRCGRCRTTTSARRVTGSTVFDFEGGGHPSVVYADECFLWVFDGATGAVRFAAPHTSFTGTEASLVADVDGDGHADLLMVSNGADPSSAGWGCMDANGNPDDHQRRQVDAGPRVEQIVPRPRGRSATRANSWVGTRTLWNEHTYHVSNICDDTDRRLPRAQRLRIDPEGRDEQLDAPLAQRLPPERAGQGHLQRARRRRRADRRLHQPAASAHVSCATSASPRCPPAYGRPSCIWGARVTQVGPGTTTQVLFPGQTQEVDVTAGPAMAARRTRSWPRSSTTRRCRCSTSATRATTAARPSRRSASSSDRRAVHGRMLDSSVRSVLRAFLLAWVVVVVAALLVGCGAPAPSLDLPDWTLECEGCTASAVHLPRNVSGRIAPGVPVHTAHRGGAAGGASRPRAVADPSLDLHARPPERGRRGRRAARRLSRGPRASGRRPARLPDPRAAHRPGHAAARPHAGPLRSAHLGSGGRGAAPVRGPLRRPGVARRACRQPRRRGRDADGRRPARTDVPAAVRTQPAPGRRLLRPDRGGGNPVGRHGGRRHAAGRRRRSRSPLDALHGHHLPRGAGLRPRALRPRRPSAGPAPRHRAPRGRLRGSHRALRAGLPLGEARPARHPGHDCLPALVLRAGDRRGDPAGRRRGLADLLADDWRRGRPQPRPPDPRQRAGVDRLHPRAGRAPRPRAHGRAAGAQRRAGRPDCEARGAEPGGRDAERRAAPARLATARPGWSSRWLAFGAPRRSRRGTRSATGTSSSAASGKGRWGRSTR